MAPITIHKKKILSFCKLNPDSKCYKPSKQYNFHIVLNI